uniref:ABC transporter domain-containing protein n=1 Tax=Parascaris univalens TaxID=6257 RepID=A0A915ALR9_PARUN
MDYCFMEFSFFQDLSFTVEPGLTVALAGRPGGQKRRTATARDLVRQPIILPLDEATSALDTESEEQIQNAIYENVKGKSVLLMAHRLSTIEMTGKNSGDVEQQDAQAELVSQNGPYRSRFQRQMMRNEEVKSALPAITTSSAASAIVSN